MWFHRKETPWEVVDSKGVAPVAMYDADDDLDIVWVCDGELSRTIVYNLKGCHQLLTAVNFTRMRVLRDASQRGYNILLCEGWQLTLLRKGKRYRLEVSYYGRPGAVVGKLPELPQPPFVNMLDTIQQQARCAPYTESDTTKPITEYIV